ncbi:MBL fold metallo-hydrolase (plasmid) [Cupriavidus neocaledonicus]|uniref:Beta-lactamase domain protein n=2 Tax=Cupriavidus neocaledonicus TaxID=1040979 RepID=A0A375HQ09_9BURK|nr:Beta-lactamase domain protein [Cupriavidus neocaledonicus]SPD60321.1 MBL fold metallo-hydrolase [Cupriavidus neocaledonicus]
MLVVADALTHSMPTPPMKMLRTSLSHFAASLVMGMAALAPGLPSDAIAAAPLVQKQGPGIYRVMVGNFEVTALLDGTHAFPIDTVVQGMPATAIADTLDQDFLKPPVQGSINAYLVNTGSKLVLIDAGAGALYGPCCGRLVDNIRAAGYQPEQVDQVLLTHLHMDHIGGIAANGKMLFPNATVRASKAEADYWLDAANKPGAPQLLVRFFDDASAAAAPYLAAHRFQPFEGDGELVPGITAMQTPGHTPGHVSYVIRSQGQTLVVWGDIVHVAALQLRHPETTVRYDSHAGSATRSRRKIFDEVVRERALVAAAHISFPGLGHLRKHGSRYEWVPVNYEAEPGTGAGH